MSSKFLSNTPKVRHAVSAFRHRTRSPTGEIPLLPWNERDRLQKETEQIIDKLVKLNSAGFLTINSQPQINGVSSTDASVGWGGPNGCAKRFSYGTLEMCVLSRVIFQKAYVEFFVSPEDFDDLLPKLRAKPSLTFMATTSSGNLVTNAPENSVNAVTWGIFPSTLFAA